MAKTKITGRADGPYLVSGTGTYVDADGNEQTTQGTMIALCRCGASANKPFCDGTHRKINFEATQIELTVDLADE